MKVNFSHFFLSLVPGISLFLFIVLCVNIMDAQQVYVFTTAGATGSVGPTQLQINTSYSATNLNGSVVSTGGVQTWTVPATGPYRMEARGAQGFGAFGGRGAGITGVFTFTAGQVLKIGVGQSTYTLPSYSAQFGGGGGTFITDANNTPYIVAGGGGGSQATSFNANSDGTISVNGNNGAGGANNALGGTAGNGGASHTYADGGAGFFTDGNVTMAASTPARSFINGLTGGNSKGIGGFGGGGGTGSFNDTRCGGGGGYSGGGGSHTAGIGYPRGGGGGSFNAGSSQVNISGLNTGAGKVTITKVCDISLTAVGVNNYGAICTGDSVTLVTDAISNYVWSTGSVTSSLSISPSVTTTYSLSATSPSNCSAIAAITIMVDQAIPSLSISNTANTTGVCPTKTIALTANGASSYTWAGNAVTVMNGIPFVATATDNYTLTAENACGTNSAITTVSVHPAALIIAAASTPSLCSGSSLSLTATGNAAAYTWAGGTSAIINGVGFFPNNTATYTVTGRTALTCTASVTVPVTVVTTPTLPPIAVPSIICIGGSSTLSAAGAASYNWISASQTYSTSQIIVTPANPGLSTFTLSKANGNCVNTRTISVTTRSLPNVSAIASPTLVCAMKPAILAIAGAQTYTWTTPGLNSYTLGGANVIVNPPAPSTYTVLASDGFCINRATVFIATNPNPVISTISTSTLICDGESLNITATGGINYTWTTTSGGSFTSATISDSPTTAIVYTAAGENSFGCISSSSQLVLVNPSPSLSVVATRSLVCSGGPSTLTARGATTYTWNVNNALTNTVHVNSFANTSGPVIYTVSGSYSTGCQSSATIGINVFVPVLSVSGNTTACPKSFLSLTAAGGNTNSYVWNTGTSVYNLQTLTSTLSTASVFTLSAISTSMSVSCTASQTLAVALYTTPLITAVAHKTLICTKESVDLIASGGINYVWNNAMSGGTISVSPTIATHYTVTGTDVNGCPGTGTVLVKVSSCNGISELSTNRASLLVYPNPNNGEFAVQADREMELVLMNELGQIVRTLFITEAGNHQIHVTDLSKGIYFLSGRDNGVQIHQKIIVTK